jgi:hypothetical protein
LSRGKKAQATGWRANLGHLGYPADATPVSLVVSSASEGVGRARRAIEDRGERGGTDVELCKLVEFDIDRILWVALVLSLDFLGL